MCNLEDSHISYDDFCDKFNLKCKLEKIIIEHIVTDSNGNQFISLNRVKALLKELECENV